MAEIPVALIVAVARNGVIGRDNDLPWKLSGDLRWFKANTLGKPIVMGRRTWESLGRPLPGRENIVVSRGEPGLPDGVRHRTSLEDAIALGRSVAQREQAAEVMVIGGAQLYAAAFPLASRLYLTEVDADVDGDTFFPAWNEQDWQEVESQPGAAREGDTHAFRHRILQRIHRKAPPAAMAPAGFSQQ